MKQFLAALLLFFHGFFSMALFMTPIMGIIAVRFLQFKLVPDNAYSYWYIMACFIVLLIAVFFMLYFYVFGGEDYIKKHIKRKK